MSGNLLVSVVWIEQILPFGYERQSARHHQLGVWRHGLQEKLNNPLVGRLGNIAAKKRQKN